ncbi:hypothetical protein JCM12296A_24020 [Desulfosarcina cetonica]
MRTNNPKNKTPDHPVRGFEAESGLESENGGHAANPGWVSITITSAILPTATFRAFPFAAPGPHTPIGRDDTRTGSRHSFAAVTVG